MTKITISCFLFLLFSIRGGNFLSRYFHLVWGSSNKGEEHLGTPSVGVHRLKKAKLTLPKKLKLTKILSFWSLFSLRCYKRRKVAIKILSSFIWEQLRWLRAPRVPIQGSLGTQTRPTPISRVQDLQTKNDLE